MTRKFKGAGRKKSYIKTLNEDKEGSRAHYIFPLAAAILIAGLSSHQMLYGPISEDGYEELGAIAAAHPELEKRHGAVFESDKVTKDELALIKVSRDKLLVEQQTSRSSTDATPITATPPQ